MEAGTLAPAAPRWGAFLARRLRRPDPRHYQIAILSGLLLYGIARLDFEIGPARALTILGGALLTQWVCTRLWRLPAFDPRSPLISGLSLTLLLRTDHLALAALAAALTIAGKFLIRRRGKHVFNPTNFSLVVMLLLTDRVWVSPGQWGSAAYFGFLLACLGGLVVNRAARSDVTYAFLGFYTALLFGRASWLGDPLAIPLHQLQNGAFLIFAFFMISDPKTTPDTRAGRILFAFLVAAGAGWVQFGLFRTNGLLWSLAACAVAVPLIDRLLPGARYQWQRGVATRTRTVGTARPARALARYRQLVRHRRREKPAAWHHPAQTIPAGPSDLAAPQVIVADRCASHPQPVSRPGPAWPAPVGTKRSNSMKRLWLVFCGAALLLAPARPADAFCGFYVAKADTKLFNRASQVALVRHDDKTVITMASDFRGDPEEFAIVIPVPTFITREQIHVTDKKLLDHLDAYSAPRLVEYFDDDPCLRFVGDAEFKSAAPRPAGRDRLRQEKARSLGVTIEAEYTVGEYDIVILSATQSDGLLTFLRREGYRLPDGAEPILGSYLKQGMRFFLARVNLEEQSKLGFSYLRPIQVAFESPKFTLPIRLGTLNADGAQELFAFVLTRKGRVETTNYRTIKLPTGMDLPLFVKDDFGDFYRDMFTRQVEKENMRGVFLEYAWNMSWCDPCAADPLSNDELRELGVFWLEGGQRRGGPQQVYLTRLHVRYDARSFPEDLVFQETGDTSNFQGRYVLRHPWKGDTDCPQARQYRESLPARFENEARNLASLTGWDINDIRARMRRDGADFDPTKREPWWKRIWND